MMQQLAPKNESIIGLSSAIEIQLTIRMSIQVSKEAKAVAPTPHAAS